jgi:large subunit ribosomal protein L24
VSQPRLHIRKGDSVLVIAGKDASGPHKGQPAKVLEVHPTVRKAVVAGRNIAKKHEKNRGPRKPGGIIEVPMPIHVSNLMLVCPSCGKPTRIKRDRVAVEGAPKSTRVIRICKRCSAKIDEA